MWEQLSATQKFRAIAAGVLAPCNVVFGMLMLSNGAGVRGLGAIATGFCLAYLSYKTATSPPAAPVSGAEFKKCPDCGKFTRKANNCRHCGHDLTQSASGAPQIKTRYTPSTTPGANSATVRCKSCQHVQLVPASQETFLCEHCKAHLKRRTAPAESS
jgi:predicted RNA-binding Zn-ribbon protein involved in translation (DUF1610 family)